MEYWKFIDGEGNTLSVESHSYSHDVPGAIQITKEEYDVFIASLSPPPPPEPNPELYVHPGFVRGSGSPSAKLAHIEDFLETL